MYCINKRHPHRALKLLPDLVVFLCTVPDLFKRTEIILEPEILDPSDPSAQSQYEELRCTDEIRLQPKTYEKLTPNPPLYINHVS